MVRTISELDLRLLQIIELRPTISVSDLAAKANTSWVTAKKHLQDLKTDKILSNPIAVFDPSKLGLDRHIILFKAKNEAQLKNLELACDLHPYTHYRTRIYGSYPGLFAQFDIPEKAERNLRKFLQTLKTLGLSDGHTKSKSTGYRKSTITNLKLYDSHSMSWKYDWNQWSTIISDASDSFPSLAKKNDSIAILPSRVELEILKQLTANADITQNALEKKLSLSQSTVSRKMIFVRENFIESIRAQIDRSRFDISSTKLYYASVASDENRAKIYNAFQSPFAPPFPLSIDLLDGGGILLWGRMPPSHEHNLFYTIWKRIPSLQVFTMDTVRDHSRLYWFYIENVDSEGRWKIDDDWVLNEPIYALKEKIENMNGE